MKRSLFGLAIFAISLFVICPFTYGQWTLQTPPSGNTEIAYDVHSINDTLVAAVGHTRIMRSEDGGATWSNKVTVTGLPFYCIHAGDNTRYFSHSGSNSWQIRMYATGSTNLTSGGKPTATLDTYKTSLLEGYVVGMGGNIQKTTDEGNTWSSPLGSGTTANLRGVYFTSSQVGYVCGDNTTLKKTTNGGANWSSMVGVPVGQLNRIAFASSSVGVTVGNAGKMLRTTNSGSTWNPVTLTTTADLNDVHFVDADTGYVCGDGGLIMKTVNGGASWFIMNTPTTYDLFGIHFSSPMAGWCVGGAAGVQMVIMKYTGGGCAIPAPTASIVDVKCPGDTLGGIDITVGSGTPPFTYSWSNGATTEDLNGIGGGSYSVTVIDSAGCIGTGSFTVAEPAAFSPGFANQNVSCNGGTDGSISMNASGGNGGYSYSWNTGATTSGLSSLAAGTYTVTVTDSLLCTYTAQATVNEPAAITTQQTITDVNCHGDSSGSATVIASGGNGGFTYAWSGGGTSITKSNLPAGLHTVTITDLKNCSVTENVSISEPPAWNVSMTIGAPSGPTTCDGVINLTVSGATPPYTYAWGVSSQLQTTASATNLCDTIHCVDITDSVGCMTDTCVNFQPVSVSPDLESYRIYPNPSSGTFNLEIRTAPANIGEASIRDVTGKEVYHFRVEQPLTRVQLPTIAKGVYTLHLQLGWNYYADKIVID